MSRDEIHDLIIVGGGPAGLSAGLYAMRAALKTVLIEKGYFGGQAATTTSVENYLGFEDIGGMELSEKFLNHALSYGLPTLRDEVIRLVPGSEYHSVVLDGDRPLFTRSIILAMGSSPRKLNVTGEAEFTGKGVSYCATCDGFFFKDQTVVVVGGGDTAAEEAIFLSKITRRVHMVHLEKSLRAGRTLQNRLLGQCNVEVHHNSTLSEIKGDENRVTSVGIRNVLSGGIKEMAVEGVFIFIGLFPNNQLIPDGIRKSPFGHVITDDKCETNIPGIFAVGDLRRKYANQISIAVGDGATAALAAAHYVETTREEKRLCELYPSAA